MPNWGNSTRRDRLPKDWPKRRRKVLSDSQYRCQIRGPRCIIEATEVDHINPGDDHSYGNLQAACAECHLSKSGAEGAAALRAHRREIAKRFKRVEDHPGEIPREGGR